MSNPALVGEMHRTPYEYWILQSRSEVQLRKPASERYWDD